MSWAPDYDWALRDEEREVAIDDDRGATGRGSIGARPAFSAANPRLRAWYATARAARREPGDGREVHAR